MKPTTGAREPHKLTDKGQANAGPLLEHAAELIYTMGVHATNNEQLRRAAGVSGSQLNLCRSEIRRRWSGRVPVLVDHTAEDTGA